MGALVSAVVTALGGWPLALAKGAWSTLIETVKTPIGAAIVAGLVCLWIGDHRGATRVEAQHTAAASKTAQTILPETVARSREVPAPSVTELAQATRKTTAAVATAVGGTVAVGTTRTTAAANEGGAMQTAVLVGLCLAGVLVAGLLLTRRWKALAEEWA